jgi:hypothetical protein
MATALRDKDGKAQVLDRQSGKPVAFDKKGIKPDLAGIVPPCRNHPPAGISTAGGKNTSATNTRPRRSPNAAALPLNASAASPPNWPMWRLMRITIDQPWTDWKGEKHKQMIGRPVAFHAMRGISAHSNGFQTCRALHVLQILLGSVEVPAVSASSRPIPNRLRRIRNRIWA